MSLIQAIGISKYYGNTCILDSVTCDLFSGAKLGLIGRNGSGKSTLLRILIGADEEFEGSVVRSDSVRIGYVPQMVDPSEEVVADYLMGMYHELSKRLRIAEERLSLAPPEELNGAMRRYQTVRDEYDAAGIDEIAVHRDRLLTDFGMEALVDHKIKTLSGGEKNMLSLIRIAIGAPDLLVLDEPGNHLDFVGLERLESFLSGYDGAVLIVSHNRYLLDRVADTILELESGSVSTYKGNYSRYRLEKLRRLTSAQADYAANQKKLARLEGVVARFAEFAKSTADPAWGRRLRARRTQLEHARREAVDRPLLDRSVITADLSSGGSKADIAIKVSDYSKRIGDRLLFDEVDFSVRSGEHVGLIGPNGCGKTTLLGDIVARGNWNDRTIRIGPSMRVGYCAQHQEVFSPDQKILDVFRSLAALTKHQVYSILRRYLFDWPDLDKFVRDLSGGELNRLQIARAQTINANLLILDEPTNHLDIAAREAVEDALDDFDGTIFVVSHDRYFLDKVADRLLVIEEAKIESYAGTFSEYWRDSSTVAKPTTPRKPRDKKSRDEARDLEVRIEKEESERKRIEAAIAEAFASGDHILSRKLSNQLDALSRRLNRLYERWELILD